MMQAWLSWAQQTLPEQVPPQQSSLEKQPTWVRMPLQQCPPVQVAVPHSLVSKQRDGGLRAQTPFSHRASSPQHSWLVVQAAASGVQMLAERSAIRSRYPSDAPLARSTSSRATPNSRGSLA